jgi:ketosteroid isomerase-like protein
MSHENVEVVRSIWKVVQDRGVEPALDVSGDFFAEHCHYEDFPEMADGATYVGADGLRERTMRFAEIWGDFVMEPREFLDGGDQFVIAVIDMTGHGKGSGAPLDAEAFFVYELEAGLIVRDRAFTSRRQALEAAGLTA